MAYQPFTPENIVKRFEELPLILSGPILRRVTTDSVTVWIALKQNSSVSLSVMDTETGAEILTSGTVSPSQIGERLYLVAVTAKASGKLLRRGTIYKYNLAFGTDGNDLRTNNIYSTDNSGANGLRYSPYDLPTFVIPPEDWKDLHILHGSCRKIHGEGLDALPAADVAISQNVGDPAKRPQFLFMTGDQIYADDVADAVLFMLRDIGFAVLGRRDMLPDLGLGYPSTEIGPGNREDVALNNLFFTSDKNVAKSHLFHFYEFCAMYLLVWSNVLWPKTGSGLPTYVDVFGTPTIRTDLQNRIYLVRQSKYVNEKRQIANFWKELPLVRRILANIPCYMICDDHEVTDDWYSTANWCARVLGTDPARRVIQNALGAYAIFQAWGNTPEQFADVGSTGQQLLQILQDLSRIPSADRPTPQQSDQLDRLLNIPPKNRIFDPSIYKNPNPDKKTDLTEQMKVTLPKGPVLYHPVVTAGKKPEFLTWHYTINARNYQIMVLDTRNWRSYPGPEGYSSPQLLSDASWDMHLNDSHPSNGLFPELTLVVSPAVPLAAPVVEWGQEARSEKDVLEKDIEGWTGQARSFQLLLAKLATRDLGLQEQTPRQRKVVILSGDVHYSFAVRLQYWAPNPYESKSRSAHAIFALFTASSFKNQSDKPWSFQDTIALHDHGYEALHVLNKRDWTNHFGWNNEAKEKTTVGRFDITYPYSRQLPLKLRNEGPAVICIERAMQQAHGNNAKLVTPSEWRYNIGYLNSTLVQSIPQEKINTQGNESVSNAHKQHLQYSESQGPGMQIVGRNNLGEVRCAFKDEDPSKPRIEQVLWWRDPEDKAPQPRTRHVISLEFNDPQDLPDPNTEVGLTSG